MTFVADARGVAITSISRGGHHKSIIGHDLAPQLPQPIPSRNRQASLPNQITVKLR